MNRHKKILITGAGGFLGKVLFHKLVEKGYNNIFSFKSSEFDLRNESNVKKIFDVNGPFDIVIHLAAIVKGIKFRKENPANMLYDNLIINLLIQEYARKNKVSKFIGLGSMTAYPTNAKIPYEEEQYLLGDPEETNRSYALAKRMMLHQGQTYRQQYNFNSIHLIMTNMYGPGYDIHSEELYVIPAMIKKFDEAISAKVESVTFWGTGNASREFLYVDDAADAIIQAMEKYDRPDPFNIGTGVETTIKEMADMIKKLIKFNGEIVWDTSKPEGKMRNVSNISKAKEFGFYAKTNLQEGLKKTIEWYMKEKSRL